MKLPSLDQLTVDSKDYIYRDGNWTTPSGYCVSTAYGQQLTMTFYERFGRAPTTPEAPALKPGRKLSAKATVVGTRKVGAGARRAPAARATMR